MVSDGGYGHGNNVCLVAAVANAWLAGEEAMNLLSNSPVLGPRGSGSVPRGSVPQGSPVFFIALPLFVVLTVFRVSPLTWP